MTATLVENGIKKLHEAVGVLLCYACAIDCTVLPALRMLAMSHSKAT